MFFRNRRTYSMCRGWPIKCSSKSTGMYEGLQVERHAYVIKSHQSSFLLSVSMPSKSLATFST